MTISEYYHLRTFRDETWHWNGARNSKGLRKLTSFGNYTSDTYIYIDDDLVVVDGYEFVLSYVKGQKIERVPSQNDRCAK